MTCHHGALLHLCVACDTPALVSGAAQHTHHTLWCHHTLTHNLQDSKPWRLQTPVKVTYFDIDQPAVMHFKQQLLSEARAATTTSKSSSQAPGDAGASSSVTGCGSQPAAQFPLLVDSWQPVAADLSQTSLASCLQSSGFDATVPCVWLAEALLYYLPLSQVTCVKPEAYTP